MEEHHDGQLGSGRGCQWSKDIEEEAVLTDLLGTEDLA